LASVARIVSTEVPAAPGVPLRVPVPLSSVSPAGRSPEVIDQLNG